MFTDPVIALSHLIRLPFRRWFTNASRQTWELSMWAVELRVLTQFIWKMSRNNPERCRIGAQRNLDTRHKTALDSWFGRPGSTACASPSMLSGGVFLSVSEPSVDHQGRKNILLQKHTGRVADRLAEKTSVLNQHVIQVKVSIFKPFYYLSTLWGMVLVGI